MKATGLPFLLSLWAAAARAQIPGGAFTTATLDDVITGYGTSLAIGVDGRGLISYDDGGLWVAHCSDPACSTATVALLDNQGGAPAQYSSLAIGADGRGLISYYGRSGGIPTLKVAHCDDIPCTTATLSTLEATGGFAARTSLAIGADGRGLIAYHHVGTGDLKVAHCEDVACTSATIATLDSAGLVGRHASLAIGADGLGLISYRDELGSDLKVAHCLDTACTSATTAVLDSNNAGWDTSIAIGPDGRGLISYLAYDLWEAPSRSPTARTRPARPPPWPPSSWGAPPAPPPSASMDVGSSPTEATASGWRTAPTRAARAPASPPSRSSARRSP